MVDNRNGATKPSIEEWKRLYDAAIKFRDAAPWQWDVISEDALFGVQDPETGEVGYCVVMGDAGEFFALGVYRGAVGYWSREDVANGIGFDHTRAISQDMLMVSFEGSKDVDKQDRAIMKELGLTFRGKFAWPVMRSRRPGFPPEHVTAAEARFLILALEQALVAYRAIQANRGLVSGVQGKVLTRVLQRDEQGIDMWIDSWTEIPPRPPLPTVQFDELRIKQLSRRAKQIGSVWEVDIYYAPFIVEEGVPLFPTMIMVVDVESEMIVHVDLADGHDVWSLLTDHFISMMEEKGVYPEAIQTMRPAVTHILSPLAKLLHIHLNEGDFLPYLDDARMAMEENLMGN